LLARDERETPIGFVNVVGHWLDQVGVVPACRGRRLGAFLVAGSLRALATEEAEEMWLCVNVNNPGEASIGGWASPITALGPATWPRVCQPRHVAPGSARVDRRPCVRPAIRSRPPDRSSTMLEPCRGGKRRPGPEGPQRTRFVREGAVVRTDCRATSRPRCCGSSGAPQRRCARFPYRHQWQVRPCVSGQLSKMSASACWTGDSVGGADAPGDLAQMIRDILRT
jgi:hypothetical protein